MTGTYAYGSTSSGNCVVLEWYGSLGSWVFVDWTPADLARDAGYNGA